MLSAWLFLRAASLLRGACLLACLFIGVVKRLAYLKNRRRLAAFRPCKIAAFNYIKAHENKRNRTRSRAGRLAQSKPLLTSEVVAARFLLSRYAKHADETL